MWEDIGEYIETLINEPGKTKVVEIAVGKLFTTAEFLEKSNKIELLSTDITPANKNIVKDDVTNPNMDIYNNAKVIYSIRPPYELQQPIMEIAKKINAILIIKPFSDEGLGTKEKMKLKNYKKARFYQYP